jgi:hypothetical protein
MLDDLFEGKVANGIQRMQKLRPFSESAQDEVRMCIKHFKEHQGRMRYAWFRKHKLLIGSGAIESVDAWGHAGSLRPAGHALVPRRVQRDAEASLRMGLRPLG